MINFDIKRSKIYSTILWDKILLLEFFHSLSLLLTVLLLLVFLQGFFLGSLPDEVNRKVLGLASISLAVFGAVVAKIDFFNNRMKKPKLRASLSEALAGKDRYNLADYLSFEVAKSVNKAVNRGKSSGHIFYYLLKDNPKLAFVFNRLLISVGQLAGEVRQRLAKNPESFDRTILTALTIARDKGHDRVMIGDMLIALAGTDKIFGQMLILKDLKVKDIESLVLWAENIEEERSKRFYDYDSLARRGTLAKEWTAGYTITLDKYGTDITEAVRNRPMRTVGHKQDIDRVERILSRTEINNVLLIGEEGTGKKGMIFGLAQRSLLGKGIPGVNYQRFVELDMPSLLADLTSSDQVEAVLDKIFYEASVAGNIILVIEGIDNYLASETKPGVVDISGIVSSYLRLPSFRLIGITNYEGLHRNIEKNPAILTLFSKVEVSGILPEETVILLEYLTFALENRYKIFIPYQSIRKIIELTDKYFPSLHFPEKAMNVLDEVAVYVSSLSGQKVVLPEHVNKIISEKSEVPIGEVESEERSVLLNLESLIHRRIINQNMAVSEVATALRRARSAVSSRKGPMGAFLFLGPTGVGKTETSKALAHFYFGSENNMIRLDMSEFQNSTDIARLIGSENTQGLLTTPVRENPFSLILLDELEKADSNILNIFLQVLDEGHITDGLGRKVSFKNTIIIATSNAGYKIILQSLKSKGDWQTVRQKILDYIFENNIFRPEFINRFDAAVIFEPLSEDNLTDIAGLILEGISKNVLEKGIEFEISEELKSKMAKLGYDPVFGARQMRRVIAEKVENVLATALLSNQIKRGDRVSVDPETSKLLILNK